MKKIFVFLVCVFSITTFAIADSPTPTPISQTYGINDSANWGQVCSDKQIYDLCNQFLIRQFGVKWAKYYTPFYPSKGIIQKDRNHRFVMVPYSFSGPANLQHLSFERNGGSWIDFGPTFLFNLEGFTPSDCVQLKLVGGLSFVKPYEPSTLIAPQEATKIAKQKGFDVQFDTLVLIGWEQTFGKFSLAIPGYEKDCGYETISVNAVDGTLRHKMRPIPG